MTSSNPEESGPAPTGADPAATPNPEAPSTADSAEVEVPGGPPAPEGQVGESTGAGNDGTDSGAGSASDDVGDDGTYYAQL